MVIRFLGVRLGALALNMEKLDGSVYRQRNRRVSLYIRLVDTVRLD